MIIFHQFFFLNNIQQFFFVHLRTYPFRNLKADFLLYPNKTNYLKKNSVNLPEQILILIIRTIIEF